ncbi:MAG: recombination mediator RecR [Kiritimatiellales bacterium]|nr:recombination mediator RecR [Kiritimatiellales bacterium]
MSLLPPQITKVIEEFSKLPGIGPKSAERLTFHLLRSSKASPEALGKSLHELKVELKYCRQCQMVSLQEECSICRDSTRDRTTILVVENPLDVVAFEKTSYKGLYHVLHGVLSPIDGMGPEQLKLRELIIRCSDEGCSDDVARARAGIKEVIVATNPDIEGEATASYIHDQLKDKVEAVTRLAHGLPMGADIEFADQVTLREAVAGRRSL